MDALVLSDLHLGSDNCQADDLCDLLEYVEYGLISPKRIILNGDLFDSIDFRRLKKKHWRVLSFLRKLSDKIEIIWLAGNHDGDPELLSHLLGVQVKDEYVLESGDKRVLFLHGDAYDEFIDTHPMLTWVADTVYMFLQMIDTSHYFARMAKHSSKTFLHCAAKIRSGALRRARKKKCQIVCCGHTHVAVVDRTDEIVYCNSGCWTEKPPTYIVINDGEVELKEFTPAISESVDNESEHRCE